MRVVGYYVHHVGTGHLRHAQAITGHLPGEVHALSSLSRPDGWNRRWIGLERDDTCAEVADPTAHGELHWAPRHDRGLSARMARIAQWIEDERPAVLVVDVSVEVAIFARLMGVPTIVMALPGARTDPAHRAGYATADALIAPWPMGLPQMDRHLQPWRGRTTHVGGLSRFAGRPPCHRPHGRRVLVLQGSGGSATTPHQLVDAAAATPGWTWQRLGPGAWSEDPWAEICGADVVVTHAGLGALADVAEARRPAIVIPEERPFGEQWATAAALNSAGIAITAPAWPPPHEWSGVLDAAVRLGGQMWQQWNIGNGAEHAARVITRIGEQETRCAPQ